MVSASNSNRNSNSKSSPKLATDGITTKRCPTDQVISTSTVIGMVFSVINIINMFTHSIIIMCIIIIIIIRVSSSVQHARGVRAVSYRRRCHSGVTPWKILIHSNLTAGPPETFIRSIPFATFYPFDNLIRVRLLQLFICEINTHPTRRQCRTHPLPSDVCNRSVK